MLDISPHAAITSINQHNVCVAYRHLFQVYAHFLSRRQVTPHVGQTSTCKMEWVHYCILNETRYPRAIASNKPRDAAVS